mmetsp:Transcript_12664/g.18611  ORF Transcript_12664/g.18611 Transcript_12664/m.18611 type:complete len:546 (-) Transcript_12664:665-2302(-)
MISHFRFSLFLFLIILCNAQQINCVSDDETCSEKHEEGVSYEVPPDCSIVMAESLLGGWGIFTLQDRERGRPVIFGDVALHLTDIPDSDAIEYLIHHFSWDAHETGGMLEGMNNVHSIVPGLGMLANAVSSKDSNVLPYKPSKDDANCARDSCAAAGSFSHYHNYTYFVHKDVIAGQEFLVRRSDKWLNMHHFSRYKEITPDGSIRSVDWLRQNGICLDNLRPKRESPGAGRGAISTRKIPKNTVVAPVPVVPIFDWKTSLKYVKKDQLNGARKKDSTEELWQLIINYSFGHANSSLLLYPYSPMVNLINHGPQDKKNVKLQWCQHPTLFPQKDWLTRNLDALKNTKEQGLLLELIATRDILPGEEIWLDYGSEWFSAWVKHVSTWEPAAGRYSPAYVMDEVVTKFRTSKEQKEYPYANNLQTFCFHDYSPDADYGASTTQGGGITAIPWNWTRHVFDWKQFRPCTILLRDEKTGLYTAQIRNRREAPLQLNKRHIVSKIPRPAIRFADRPHTTDQHLSNAFRHWIGIPDEIFPRVWKNEMEGQG